MCVMYIYNVFIHVCVCVYICMHVCMYVCIYIYVYMCLCMYMYIYTYTYIIYIDSLNSDVSAHIYEIFLEWGITVILEMSHYMQSTKKHILLSGSLM